MTNDLMRTFLAPRSFEGERTTLKVSFEIVKSSSDTHLPNDMSLFLRVQVIVISARYLPILLINVTK